MVQFINGRDALVTEAIDGMLRAAGGANVARLDGFPHIKVVVRTDHTPSRVAVISGGGSGHEPAHAGFVGKGMLTAAVCGDVFASPSVEAVLAGIMAVTGEAGCLLIVKNYTGDRLNFGLAAERARANGLRVEMVVVADDIALPGLPQPRGVAGTLFVHKIAGHMAERGASLAAVAAAADKVAKSIVSLGISVSSCSFPGMGRNDRVPTGKAELGLGIHGEPGVEMVDFSGAREAAALLSARLAKRAPPARGYALLLNNLGGTTPLEMGVLAHEILSGALGRKIRLVVGPAPMMTSLDMHGFSASLLPLTSDFERALLSDAAPSAWPGVRVHAKPVVLRLAKRQGIKSPKASRDPALAALVQRICDILVANEARLNALDAKTGDGDTGSTVATAARSVKGQLDRMPQAELGAFFAAISDTLATTMGGSSGVLLAILFAAASRAAAGGESWAKALVSGMDGMMAHGGARPGDRTMIDSLKPALDRLAGGGSLIDAARQARRGADATALMERAGVGRSSYLGAGNLAGNIDPGAEAVAALFEGLAAA
jgi:dihydroxyacetone kinase